MKKKLICTLMTAVLVAATLAPTAASAAQLKGDIDGDNMISYEDVNGLNQLLKNGNDVSVENYDINGDGVVDEKDVKALSEQVVPTGILGDVNNDGQVSLEDYNLQINVIHNAQFHQITVDGKYIVVYNEGSTDYYFDAANADINGDGYFGPSDLYVQVPATDILGDVNNDGKVDSKDGYLFKQYLMDHSTCINGKNSDVNGDQKLNIADYLALQKLYK